MARNLFSHRPAAVLCSLVLIAVGCSGRADVVGRVHYPDGTPLDTGLVVCEPVDGEYAGKLSARGVIQPDGTFKLGVDRAAEGVPPARYKVLVVGRYQSVEELEQEPPVVAAKYNSFDTSEIVLDVPAGGATLDITVTRGPAPRTARGNNAAANQKGGR
jgi:hypothetical protein